MLRQLVITLALAPSLATLAPAAPPYTSAGFLTFPAEVEVGALSAVVTDRDDNLYVLHRGEIPVVVFDANGKFVRGFGQGKFKVPHGLRIDREGFVWTTDNGLHILRKFTPEGRLVTTLGVEGKAAAGKEGFRAPDDLVFDSQGNFYIADAGNGRIVKLNPAGEYVSEWGKKGKESGQFATAHGLAIDASDRIYVADRGNKRVQVFDTTGKHLADWTGFGNPFGLVASNQSLIASEGDVHKLIELDLKTGQVLSQWGDPQSLLLPHFMTFDSKGTLYVTEVNGKRVQKFVRGTK